MLVRHIGCMHSTGPVETRAWMRRAFTCTGGIQCVKMRTSNPAPSLVLAVYLAIIARRRGR